jgi:3-hydroxyisobutyrate dehydrogenase
MKVAFLGLGNMGGPMARNVLKAGHELTVYNRTAAKTKPLADAGAKVAETPVQAARGAGIVCFCVSTPDDVRSVVLGDEGALSGAESGAVFVDFSTVDPETSRELAEACSSEGVDFLDAPVSGGVEGAAAGSLTVMVGGEAGAVERARPVLDAVGERVVHTGPSGSGSAVKLINQMLVGVNLAAVLEAFVMAEAAGIDTRMLCEILGTSAGSSTMLTRATGLLLERNFEPGFTVDLLSKDLDLGMRMGRDLRSPLFTLAVARQLYTAASAAGLGGKDMTAAVIPMQRLRKADSR